MVPMACGCGAPGVPSAPKRASARRRCRALPGTSKGRRRPGPPGNSRSRRRSVRHGSQRRPSIAIGVIRVYGSRGSCDLMPVQPLGAGPTVVDRHADGDIRIIVGDGLQIRRSRRVRRQRRMTVDFLECPQCAAECGPCGGNRGGPVDWSRRARVAIPPIARGAREDRQSFADRGERRGHVEACRRRLGYGRRSGSRGYQMPSGGIYDGIHAKPTAT